MLGIEFSFVEICLYTEASFFCYIDFFFFQCSFYSRFHYIRLVLAVALHQDVLIISFRLHAKLDFSTKKIQNRLFYSPLQSPDNLASKQISAFFFLCHRPSVSIDIIINTESFSRKYRQKKGPGYWN